MARRYSLALLTGGSSGIGLAFAKILVSQGTSVILAARRLEQLQKAKEGLDLEAAAGAAVHLLPMDVADAAAVAEAVDSVLRDIGVPDLVYCGAGLAYPDHFHNVGLDSYRTTMSVNMDGIWNVLSAIIPAMKVKRCGTVVTVSSVAGLVGTYGYTAYAASKFAVMGFSQSLRNEMRPEGIDVKILCPPDTDTPGLAEEDKTKPDETRKISGAAGCMKPEVVAAILYRNLRSRKFVILPGFMSKITWYLYRLAPRLVHAIIDGDVKTVRKVST